ncbi:MAG: ATPase, T2SS/T4P/T4SS family [Gemmatimonadota bacterium]|nr:ATPase, T2SS/T4P/T4SS family [Gemmatimonadota bacterium]
MQSTSSSHWLKDVAGHAGLALDLPPRLDLAMLRKAWTRVVEACGTTEAEFTRRAASHFRIGVADVSQRDPQAVRLIPESVARRYGILAVSLTERNVVVATSDPSNRAALKAVVDNTGREPVLLMASPTAIAQALDRAYAPQQAPGNSLQELVAEVAESDFQVVTSDGRGSFTSFELEDPAVVKLADVILQQAVRYRATEVHIEPDRQRGRVRYRIDGVLQQVVPLPAAAHQRLVARLKYIAEGVDARADGGFLVQAGRDLKRVAHLLTTPTPDGELASVRLVRPDVVPTLDTLGFDGPEGETIRELLERPDGLVLVTGPARSGTTSFIHASMFALNKRNVLSLEGRVELHVPGVTQIRYDASTGLSFAETLQTLLDRDPDVVHAGEIRDLATARIALRTAVTGRKVLATVHTPDAVSGIRRLRDLGLAAGRLAESLHAVVSLRLVRRLCPHCARSVDMPDDLPSRERKLAGHLGVLPPRRAVGCRACAGTGYHGQLPVAEVLVLTPGLRALLSEGAEDEDLQMAARMEGMRELADVALDRVGRGETTVEEVERVLGIVPPREETPSSAGPILLVEDEAQDRLLIGSIVRDLGFDVIEAETGEEAVELLEKGEHVFSMVLLDLMLPGMDGLDVLRRIRQSLTTQFLPVLVLTSSPDPRNEIALLDHGADDYMLKPVAVTRLQARVRAVLRRSGVRIGDVTPDPA